MKTFLWIIKWVGTGAVIAILNGCAHQLEIRNIGMYSCPNYPIRNKETQISVQPSGTDAYSDKLATSVSRQLNHYLKVTSECTPDTDLIASYNITPKYKGSGWNFLINWPGYLIWAPAWNGYAYTIDYDVDVKLYEPGKRNPVDHFNLPVNLDIHHASMDRTWTEISGPTAFVGGFVFMKYDHDVTHLVVAEEGPLLGNYIAKVIAERGIDKVQVLNQALN